MIDIGPHLLGCNPHVEHPSDEALEDHLSRHGTTDRFKAALQGSPADLADESFAFIVAFYRWLTGQTGTTPAPGPVSALKPWRDRAHLNQGRSGHCVGFGWAGWLASAPIEDVESDADGHAIYYAAKIIDGQPGMENGSTVRSGAQVMIGQGRMGQEAYTRNADTVAAWLSHHGPVVFGTEWTQDMFHPDASGLVSPTGGVAGGHCYLGREYLPDTDLIRCRNSWSEGWGVKGDFYIARSDMQTLLDQQGGIACAAVEVGAPERHVQAAEETEAAA
jgi:hypothetical protein